MRKRTAAAADVAVVGGGAIGVSIAWELARRGASVILLERGPELPWGCSAGNAGIVGASHVVPLAEPAAVHPVDVLRSRASDADARLIVVGSRGRGPVRGALLGSVSASLAASAPAPVLVVPRTAELIGLGGGVAGGLPAAA